MTGWLRSGDSGPLKLMHSSAISTGWINQRQRKERQGEESDDRSRTVHAGPGQRGARYRRTETSGRSFSVRDLRHPPEKVWQALTDPAQLREWAPFDADRSLGTVGTAVKLTTVGAPTPHVTETTVTRADAPRVLEYNWGGFDMRWELEPRWRRHAADAVAQHRSPVHLDGGGRLAHLLSTFWITFSAVIPSAASSPATR